MEKVTAALTKPLTIETRAVSCVPNKDLCHDMDVHGYPTVLFFRAGSVNGTKVAHWDMHPNNVLRLIGGVSDEGLEDVDMRNELPDDNKNSLFSKSNMRQKEASGSNQKVPHFMDRSKRDIYKDAHLSLDFALRSGVYTSPGELDQKKKSALRQFLTLLQKCSPPGSTMQPLVADLLDNFSEVSKGDAELNAILDRHAKPADEWSAACLQHGTGYTCGLWQLFHIVTIGLVEWNKIAYDKDMQLHTMVEAEHIRGFIANFFLCDECRGHFVSEFDNCMYDRCNRLVDHADATVAHWIQFPLWLFEQHNGVNIRLRKERIDRGETEDATESEVMWPPLHKCPSCWLSEGRWDEEKVYGYMRLEYWPEDAESQAFRQLLLDEQGAQSGNNKMNHAHQHYVPQQHPFSDKALREDAALDRMSALPNPDGLLVLALVLFAAAAGLTSYRKKLKLPGKSA